MRSDQKKKDPSARACWHVVKFTPKIIVNYILCQTGKVVQPLSTASWNGSYIEPSNRVNGSEGKEMKADS